MLALKELDLNCGGKGKGFRNLHPLFMMFRKMGFCKCENRPDRDWIRQRTMNFKVKTPLSSPPNCRHSVQGCLCFPLLTLSPFPQEIKRASLRFSGNSNLQLKKLKPILTNVGKNYFTCGSQNGCSPCFSKCKDFGKLSQKRRLNIQSVSSSSFPRRSES